MTSADNEQQITRCIANRYHLRVTTAPLPFVSRAGLKLAHALETFKLDVTNLVCADFGCNVGGFTDCLLQRGAAHVYALDTGYGTLAWKLRNDTRVTVMERTNALHADPPGQPINFITIDLGWTPQRHAIPAALRWLQTNPTPESQQVITLIKPHYELTDSERKSMLKNGKLEEADSAAILERTLTAMPSLGMAVLNYTQSPILGGASKGKAGNIEYLALCQPL